MHCCVACGLLVWEHHEQCRFGCHHFPAVCCPGCPCGSFEEAHGLPTPYDIACYLEATGSYEDGAALGCPDCVTGIEHCCPFLWADAQPEPDRTRWLRHCRQVLSDITEEITCPVPS